MRAALLAINRPTAPFIVRDGAPEGVDFVAQWRTEASWLEIFGATGLKKSFQVLMTLDPQNCEVRHFDRSRTSEWGAGTSGLTWEKEYKQGQLWEYSWCRRWFY